MEPASSRDHTFTTGAKIKRASLGTCGFDDSGGIVILDIISLTCPGIRWQIFLVSSEAAKQEQGQEGVLGKASDDQESLPTCERSRNEANLQIAAIYTVEIRFLLTC